MRKASFLDFILPVAIVVITVAILLLWYYWHPAHEEHSGLMYLGVGSLPPSSLSSLSWIALCRSNKAFVLALSSGERCTLSNTSVQFVNFWTPKKNIFSHNGMTTVINTWLTFTLFFSNSLVWQNSHPDHFESFDLVLALYSEQFTLQWNLTYKREGHC